MKWTKFFIIALLTISVEIYITWKLANWWNSEYVLTSFITTPVITFLVYVFSQGQSNDGGSAMSKLIDASVQMDTQLRVHSENHDKEIEFKYGPIFVGTMVFAIFSIIMMVMTYI